MGLYQELEHRNPVQHSGRVYGFARLIQDAPDVGKAEIWLHYPNREGCIHGVINCIERGVQVLLEIGQPLPLRIAVDPLVVRGTRGWRLTWSRFDDGFAEIQCRPGRRDVPGHTGGEGTWNW